MTRAMPIGQVAALAQCTVQTIRYYETERLLAEPARTATNYRVYSTSHVERLIFIRNCRSLDMTLDEIRELLNLKDVPQESCASTHLLLEKHLEHVSERMEELRRLERQLKVLRRRCRKEGVDPHCRILKDLGREAPRTEGKKSAPHVRGAHGT